MRNQQLTLEERYALSAFRKQGYNQSQIARALGRHRSTNLSGAATELAEGRRLSAEYSGRFHARPPLEQRTVKAANRRAISLIKKAPLRVRTLTLDNGTEFQGYKEIEASTNTTV